VSYTELKKKLIVKMVDAINEVNQAWMERCVTDHERQIEEAKIMSNIWDIKWI